MYGQAKQAQGAPKGNAQLDQVRQQILGQLEQMGVLAQIKDEAQKANLMALVDELAQAVVAGDQAAIQNNPITKMLQQGAAPQGAAPQGGMM